MSIANLCVLRGYSNEQGEFQWRLRNALSGKELPGQFLVRYRCGKVWKIQKPSPSPARLRKTKLEIRNSKLGSPKRKPKWRKRLTHPFKRQNRKGRPPLQEKTNSSSFKRI